jgi:HK97 family phage major capsid protein
MIMRNVGFANAKYSTQLYDETFGKAGVMHGQVYGGGLNKTSYEDGLEKQEEMNKTWNASIQKAQLTTSQDFATGTNYSSTSGSIPALIPLGFSKEIINLSRKKTPVYELLPKMAVRGKFYTWNKATFASSNAAFKFEDAAMNDYNDDYAPSVLEMKYAYAVGRVSGPMQIASQEYINAEQNEIKMKSRALLQLIENKIVNGDASSNSEEFSGLTTLITTNSTSLSDSIAVSDIRDHIMYCEQGGKTYSAQYGGGSPDLIITNRQTLNDIKALLQSFLRYNDISTTLAWGMRAVEFEGIPIVTSAFMTTTSASKELYIIDTDVVRLAVSLPMTMERLAKTDDSNKFMIKFYGALWVGNERWCAKIDTIT